MDIQNNVQLGQPVDDIDESEEFDKMRIRAMQIIEKALSRTNDGKKKSKEGQSRSNVQDCTLKKMSTPPDSPFTIFNNEESYLTDSTDKGRQLVFDELKDIAPKKSDILSKSDARRFLGVSYHIFQFYEDKLYFHRHKDEDKIVYYRYELIEFLKSGKRLSSYDESALNKKLRAANDKENNTKKLY
jgi:hypothetical protein